MIHVEELNQTNCKTYLLTAGGEAALVDPLREHLDAYRQLLAERGLRLKMVLETHMHADHMMLSRACKELLGAPLIMHQLSPSPLVDRHLVDGETLELGGAPIRVLHTPGHTPDSVSYFLGDSVISGDTLLVNATGRTDFPGGDAGAQYDSIQQKLFALPDETVLWPGHDYKGNTHSTIGAQRRDNPRLVGKSRSDYIKQMAELGLPLPDKIQQVLQVNQSGFEPGEVAFPLVQEVAKVDRVEVATLARRLGTTSRPLVLDVREPEEFTGELGHIEGALLVPLDALERRMPKLAGYHDREVVVVCRAGARSGSAAALLRQAGFRRVSNLEGGMVAWATAGLSVQH